MPIDPESPKNKGNVEIWLLELEGMQWESIRKQCELCLNDYLKQKRSAWILCWCAQAILAVSQIYWTADCEAAFDKGGHQELDKYRQVCSDNLLETVYMVRGKLSKLERKTLSALCVIDMHAISTKENMVKLKIDSTKDFEWMSQLRYYWFPSKDARAV